MEALPFFAILALIYAFIFFVDMLFRSCLFFPYIMLLDDAGITIKPFMISWESSRFNRQILSYGRFMPSLLRRWFQVGSLVVSLLMIPAMTFLLLPVYNILISRRESSVSNEQVLVPVIPGYNLPISHTPYYILAVFISAVIHEFGHALAASRERIPIEGCGMSLCGILPVAYVKLPSELLKNLTLPQQLRIYSAGIWHNIVLTAFALLLIYANPIILRPIYDSGNGVTVLSVKQESSLSKAGGLAEHDHVISVNDCPVHNAKDWFNCLSAINSDTLAGFCTSKLFITMENVYKPKQKDCCNNSFPGYTCFNFFGYEKDAKACLPIRKLAEEPMCKTSDDCLDLCVLPVPESSSERFIKVKKATGTPVLYIGSVQELYSSVSISPWVAKFISVRFVDMYETLLEYLVMFSSGIAIINIIPFFWLDGHFLCEGVVNFFLSDAIPLYSQRRNLIYILKFTGCIVVFSTMLLSLNELSLFH